MSGYKKQGKQASLGAVYNVDTQGFTTPILVIVGVGILGGIVYFGYRAYAKGRKNTVLDRSFDDGTPEAFAQRLKSAMGGGYDGTDEASIIKVFSEIPNQAEYEKVEKAYQKLTQTNLNEALEGELSSYYLDKLRVIKNTKAVNAKTSAPEGNYKQIAKMLKEAIEGTTFSSTDVELLFDAFKLIPDKPTYEKVKTEYRTTVGKELWADIEGEWDLTTSWNGFVDYFSNAYAGKGETYLETLKKETIERFNEL